VLVFEVNVIVGLTVLKEVNSLRFSNQFDDLFGDTIFSTSEGGLFQKKYNNK